jgi:hypothetical protein
VSGQLQYQHCGLNMFMLIQVAVSTCCCLNMLSNSYFMQLKEPMQSLHPHTSIVLISIEAHCQSIPVVSIFQLQIIYIVFFNGCLKDYAIYPSLKNLKPLWRR